MVRQIWRTRRKACYAGLLLTPPKGFGHLKHFFVFSSCHSNCVENPENLKRIPKKQEIHEIQEEKNIT